LHKFREKHGLKVVKNRVKRKKPSAKKKEIFSRENSIDEIRSYLIEQKALNKPIKIFYRDDLTSRTLHGFNIDGPYLKVRNKKGYYIKFLIDRIRKIDR
jgi:hypothetical protein